MPASFELAWRDDGGILMVKRSGLMTLEEADQYVQATRRALAVLQPLRARS